MDSFVFVRELLTNFLFKRGKRVERNSRNENREPEATLSSNTNLGDFLAFSGRFWLFIEATRVFLVRIPTTFQMRIKFDRVGTREKVGKVFIETSTAVQNLTLSL